MSSRCQSEHQSRNRLLAIVTYLCLALAYRFQALECNINNPQFWHSLTFVIEYPFSQRVRNEEDEELEVYEITVLGELLNGSVRRAGPLKYISHTKSFNYLLQLNTDGQCNISGDPFVNVNEKCVIR